MKQKDYKKEIQAYIDMIREDYPDLSKKEVVCSNPSCECTGCTECACLDGGECNCKQLDTE